MILTLVYASCRRVTAVGEARAQITTTTMSSLSLYRRTFSRIRYLHLHRLISYYTYTVVLPTSYIHPPLVFQQQQQQQRPNPPQKAVVKVVLIPPLVHTFERSPHHIPYLVFPTTNIFDKGPPLHSHRTLSPSYSLFSFLNFHRLTLSRSHSTSVLILGTN